MKSQTRKMFYIRYLGEYGGGEGGIRTPDTVARMPHFECGAFNHSATSPSGCRTGKSRWCGRSHNRGAAAKQAPRAASQSTPHRSSGLLGASVLQTVAKA